ncbi:AMP-binding protein [Pseudomonas sp. UFMG81]|uniref:AMP-binding protein n=1 Tax=Pseudomonas sp. UFMG81 TaxID=2745936 RepID=UPI00188E9A10|nr:AMP-binding protein [Pseudomonas sp. UFMG81]
MSVSHSLKRLVDFARAHSAYYAQLYQDLPLEGWALSDLPLVEPGAYWHKAEVLSDWPVLTGPMTDAIVFKTGGTTGGGKYSVYSHDEWARFTAAFGRSLHPLLQPGDRVANLFFAGDLYASFLFAHGAMSCSRTPVCEFPFTGIVEPDVLTAQIKQHGINVLVGVPGKLLQYASTLAQAGETLPGIRAVLYGGESVFEEQLHVFEAVFSNARVASIGCASVDAGLIGASVAVGEQGEHRAFEPETLVEIVDEVTGVPIEEPGRTGVLLVTDLGRTLMPVIRYPVGDLAAWCEPAGGSGRAFILQGRSGLGHRVRVGYATLFPDDLAQLIEARLGRCQWQLLIEQAGGVDRVTLRIAHDADPQQAHDLIAQLQARDSALSELVSQGALRIGIQWCRPADIVTNGRTGKLLRVIDRRSYGQAAQGAVS